MKAVVGVNVRLALVHLRSGSSWPAGKGADDLRRP